MRRTRFVSWAGVCALAACLACSPEEEARTGDAGVSESRQASAAAALDDRLGRVATSSGARKDVFGIPMLYGDAVRPDAPSPWFLTQEGLADAKKNPGRFDPGRQFGKGVTLTSEVHPTTGTTFPVLTAGGDVRMNVHSRTIVAYTTWAKANTIWDHSEFAARGHMMAPDDWRNVEITGYLRVNVPKNTAENLAWYARGGRHTSGNPCEGSAYKGHLYYTDVNGGERGSSPVRVEKESWHGTGGYLHSAYAQGLSPVMYEKDKPSRWVGFKTVIRDLDGACGASAGVRIELFVDGSGASSGPGEWEKVYALTDCGAWGGGDYCGWPMAPIVWGGPLATFRWDASDNSLKWASVREIDPTDLRYTVQTDSP